MAAREASSGLSSPGPDSEVEHADERSRPVTSNGENGSTPLRNLAPGAIPRKNKESPSPENDDDQPAKKKRHRRTRADLEADKRAAELYPELYIGKKNPRLIDPNMKRPPLPGEPGYRGSPGHADRLAHLKNEVNGSPPIRMMPYAATLAPDHSRRESAPSTPRPASALPSPSSNGNMPEPIHAAHHPIPTSIAPPPPAMAYSSAPVQSNPSPRSIFDPIRGYSTAELPRSNHPPHPPHPPPASASAASPQSKLASAPSVITNRASASPAISSLIDPPDMASQPPPPPPQVNRSPLVNSTSSANASNPTNAISDTIIVASNPQPAALASNAEFPARTTSAPAVEAPRPVPSLAPREMVMDSAMEVDLTSSAPKPHSSRASASSGTSPHNGPAKPKEKREKPPLPPLPGSGSGMLTSAMLGVPAPSTNGAGAAAATAAEGDEAKPTPTVCIDIKLENTGNNIINFSRMAEEKYGFNALHPRLAAQKERLARVAAAGAMLENEARARAKGLDPDAMSEDLDGGSEDEKNAESNAEMGGVSGADGPPKRKKRNFKEDNYDKEDPFVDDSELGLEEHAALATDGFFVYCGPLVEEGRMPTIQGRPDGLGQPSGRGRGRGRGRGGGPGSRGGRVSTGEASGTGRGGGPGSRGGRGGRGRGRGRGAANSSPATSRDANNTQPQASTTTTATATVSTGGGTSDLANYLRNFPANEQSTPSKPAGPEVAAGFPNGGNSATQNPIVVE